MKIVDGLLAELEQEAQTTRRVLERIPQAHLSWNAAKRPGSSDHVEPLVSPSRSVAGLPAAVEFARAVCVWADCGRKSVHGVGDIAGSATRATRRPDDAIVVVQPDEGTVLAIYLADSSRTNGRWVD